MAQWWAAATASPFPETVAGPEARQAVQFIVNRTENVVTTSIGSPLSR
jgi:hypothetical protein